MSAERELRSTDVTIVGRMRGVTVLPAALSPPAPPPDPVAERVAAELTEGLRLKAVELEKKLARNARWVRWGNAISTAGLLIIMGAMIGIAVAIGLHH